MLMESKSNEKETSEKKLQEHAVTSSEKVKKLKQDKPNIDNKQQTFVFTTLI